MIKYNSGSYGFSILFRVHGKSQQADILTANGQLTIIDTQWYLANSLSFGRLCGLQVIHSMLGEQYCLSRPL
jgi:hypothetical protein